MTGLRSGHYRIVTVSHIREQVIGELCGDLTLR